MNGSVVALNSVSEIESVEISYTKYSVFRNSFGTIPCFIWLQYNLLKNYLSQPLFFELVNAKKKSI